MDTREIYQMMLDADMPTGGLLNKPQWESLPEPLQDALLDGDYLQDAVCPAPGDEPPVYVVSDDLLDGFDRWLRESV